MRRARFRVIGRFDRVRVTEGTVTIERSANIFTVRPLRRRRTFELPLDVVAQMVVERVCRAEVLAKQAERKARRLAKRA